MYRRKKTNNPLLRKFNGFLKCHRNIFQLLHLNEMTQQEFVMYIFGVAISDWDPKHTDTYGSFAATNADIADALGFKSDSTVSRTKSSLVKKGYFLRREDDRLEPFDFEEWLLRKPSAK